MPQNISKLNMDNFPEQRKMTKDDFVMICGDFGGVWNNGKEDLFWQKWLENKKFTTLFVDGNHENHALLSAYPVQMWSGGKVHFISPSVIHLMRGQVFNLAEKLVFTMGGASSGDIEFRKEGTSWWKEEMPSEDEYAEALRSLDACGWRVDYVFTHTVPTNVVHDLGFQLKADKLTEFLDQVYERLTFTRWYAGHLHMDRDINEKLTVRYSNVEKVY